MRIGAGAGLFGLAVGLAACNATGAISTTGGTSNGGTGTTGGTSSGGGTSGGTMPAAPYSQKPFDRVHISSTVEPNLRQADAAYGNFETTAIDLERFSGQSYPGRDDWALAAVCPNF